MCRSGERLGRADSSAQRAHRKRGEVSDVIVDLPVAVVKDGQEQLRALDRVLRVAHPQRKQHLE